jgi:hypothetical protein
MGNVIHNGENEMQTLTGLPTRKQPLEYQRYGEILLEWISRNRIYAEDCVQSQDLILVVSNLWVPLPEYISHFV